MKILVLADVESKYYWDFFSMDKLNDIDLILSAGDLKAEFLSFLATYAKVPILYVHGNHDASYETKPPEGCICIEDKIYKYNGIRILGLGGSIRYKNGPHQYTQFEMKSRVAKLKPKIFFNRGFDILLTHAPAYHIYDGDDKVHEGFEAFVSLIDKYSPKFFVHGHIHMNYGMNNKRERNYKETRIINAYDHYIIEFE
ncbi:MAG: metallophosphoesterase [Lachnospiraceae bacterium]|nr:metallophosphoesterase [Lachnospiraceae bacterium]